MHTVGTALILALASAQLVAADAKPVLARDIRGLDPALEAKYKSIESTGQFTCLDGSATLAVSAINDDYCDCPDGSDEPGTSACEGRPSAYFYCKNEGHVPGKILSSRVNDGLCDPECCDGTDEWATGACPNNCAEVGKAYKEKVAAELKTRKTGSKIRSSYIKWAVNEKNRLQEELSKNRAALNLKQRDHAAAQAALERAEAGSKADLEKRKQSPLYTHTLSQKLALTRLRSKAARLENNVAILQDILTQLSKGYNPNYQDMAVKAAVVGYEQFLEPVPEDDSEDEVTDAELDEIDKKDLEGLLLGEQVDAYDDDEESLLYKIEEYIPDSLYDSWESARDLAIDWLIRLGLFRGHSAGPKTDGPHVAAAREHLSKLSNELKSLENALSSTEETLKKMEEQYGPEAEWKKLENTCVSQVAGDYTYEFCFFGQATQKSNKDGSSNNLGRFTGWKDGETPGSYGYYTRQKYRNGAKCWNGPSRSATVDLSCGTSNQLLTVAEPEKCEYFFKATSPALCWPIKEEGEAAKDEL